MSMYQVVVQVSRHHLLVHLLVQVVQSHRVGLTHSRIPWTDIQQELQTSAPSRLIAHRSRDTQLFGGGSRSDSIVADDWKQGRNELRVTSTSPPYTAGKKERLLSTIHARKSVRYRYFVIHSKENMTVNRIHKVRFVVELYARISRYVINVYKR